jgi:hypothetical protein
MDTKIPYTFRRQLWQIDLRQGLDSRVGFDRVPKLPLMD